MGVYMSILLDDYTLGKSYYIHYKIIQITFSFYSE